METPSTIVRPGVYTGVHSGGGTVWLEVTADGRYVQSFKAERFCDSPNTRLWLMDSKIRILGFGFEYPDSPFGGPSGVFGTFLAGGTVTGTISYDNPGGCTQHVTWAASHQ